MSCDRYTHTRTHKINKLMLKNKKLKIEEDRKDISNFELSEKEGGMFLRGGVEASVSSCGSAGPVLQIVIASNPPVRVSAVKASTKRLQHQKQQVQKS